MVSENVRFRRDGDCWAAQHRIVSQFTLVTYYHLIAWISSLLTFVVKYLGHLATLLGPPYFRIGSPIYLFVFLCSFSCCNIANDDFPHSVFSLTGQRTSEMRRDISCQAMTL